MDYRLILDTYYEIDELPLPNIGGSITIGEGENDTFRLEGRHVKLTLCEGGIHLESHTPVRVGDEIEGQEKTICFLSKDNNLAYIAEGAALIAFEDRCDEGRWLPLGPLPFDEVRIGRDDENDIRLKGIFVFPLHALLQREEGRWFIRNVDKDNGVFVDGQLLALDAAAEVRDDMSIYIGGFMLKVRDGALYFENTPGKVSFAPRLKDALSQAPGETGYPYFDPSPSGGAVREPLKVELPAPKDLTKPSFSRWTLAEPLLMLLITGGVALIRRAAMMLYYIAPMVLLRLTGQRFAYKGQRKKWEQARAGYEKDLREAEERIAAAEEEYRSALVSAHPDVDECLDIAETRERRLWGRMPGDVDFLNVRLGTGQGAFNVNVKLPGHPSSGESPSLIDAWKRAKELKERHDLDGLPICHSFQEAPATGLVGGRDDVQRMAWAILLDIATHHSYRDVKIVCIYPEDEKERWAWVRWLPHTWNEERTRRFLACTQDEARPMLQGLGELLRERQAPSGGDAAPAMPFYFLLLADRELVQGSGERFLPQPGQGFAAVYAYDEAGALPRGYQALIDFREKKRGKPPFLQRIPNGKHIPFTPDDVELEEMDAFARALAPVRLPESDGAAGIPTFVPFLRGFGVSRVEELKFPDWWARSDSTKSLAVPIGVGKNGGTFKLDVHEKAMGPHGLVAGMTGWGKSEMLTTWLLSLALHFSPEDVSFVLVEFKGNDLSNILRGLPHIAGVVSNLDDPASIERALRSLEAENERRQGFFSKVKDLATQSLPAYQAYRRKHPEREDLKPLSYLLVVVDEFAQFMAQVPDQKERFDKLAQTGRSLGMYMVLATQSPQGIVSGQVTANTRYRVCLKVATREASKEMIGTGDAFSVSSKGRAWVKVDDDPPEPVQTFFSKAPYNPGANARSPAQEVHIVTLNGERVRREEEDGGEKGDLTEGQAVANFIEGTARKRGVPLADPVWMEPLPKFLSLEEIWRQEGWETAFDNGRWNERNNGLSILMGRVDNLKDRTQGPLRLDFMKDGHQVIFGMPGSGKTAFLQTAVMSTALSYTPEQVMFLLLDFGRGMKMFEKLPHTYLLANEDREDTIEQAREALLKELRARQRLFEEYSVGTLRDYRAVSRKPLPAVLVVVDNMILIQQHYEGLFNALVEVARDGAGRGIYLLVATGHSWVMQRITNNVQALYALELKGWEEYHDLLKTPRYQEPARFPGRGLTQGGLEFQTALYARDAAQEEGERGQYRREICKEMAKAWTGKRPALVSSQIVDANSLTFDHDFVRLSVDGQEGGPLDFVFKEMNSGLIFGLANSGKTNLLGLIALALYRDPDTTVYIYEQKPFLALLCPDARIAKDEAGFIAMINEIAAEYDRRNKGEGEDFTKGRIALCVDDFPRCYNFNKEKVALPNEEALGRLIRQGVTYEIYVYLTGRVEELDTFASKSVKSCLLEQHAVVMLGGRQKDYAFVKLHKVLSLHKNLVISGHDGCLIYQGEARRFTPVRLAAPDPRQE